MRATISSVSLLSLSMLATAPSLASSSEFYVQTATFKIKHHAQEYQHQLSQKVQYPVNVEKRGEYQVVYVGPIKTSAEALALSRKMHGAVIKNRPNSTHIHPVDNPDTPKSITVHLADHPVQEVVISPLSNPNHFEVIGAVGIATLGMGNSSLQVTSSETDKLVRTGGNDWNRFTAQLGGGYLYYRPNALQYSENVQWFPFIEPQVNGYYMSRKNITGDVWRFNSNEFNDMTYTMSISSTRLMFDTALTIVSKDKYALYTKGGIGNAWNRIGYSDADKDSNPSCLNQRLNLNTATSSKFAWEAGAGLLYTHNTHVGISLEYLYTDLGKATLSSHGNIGTITTPVISSSSFHMNTQAVLLGLHVAV